MAALPGVMPPHDLAAMRAQLKQLHRSSLPQMGWCDDNARRRAQVDAAYASVRHAWDAEAGSYPQLLLSALYASTTDDEQQSIRCTLSTDRSFWSSTGSSSQVAHEALTYQLPAPDCRVVALRLAVYRALYQQGYPVYPPMKLQVWIGPSPGQLQPASPWHDVAATDALQTFALWPHAPIGRFLQVRMFGKAQKQEADLAFYVAIRHVAAYGTCLSTQQALALRPLLNSGAARLADSLPGCCCPVLEAAAVWGCGPQEAAREQLALQGTEGAELQAPSSWTGQLVTRQPQQQQERRNQQQRTGAARRQQQQEKGRSRGGIWSFLGGLHGGRDSAPQAAAVQAGDAAAAMDTDDAQEQQQQGGDGDLAAAAQQPLQPRWLSGVVPVAADKPRQPPGSEAEPAADGGSDTGSEPTDGDDESDDAAAGSGAARAAAPDLTELHHHQRVLAALMRRVHPWQQEQMLAHLLEDEPLPAAHDWQQQQQQQHEVAEGGARAGPSNGSSRRPPAIKLQSGTCSGSSGDGGGVARRWTAVSCSGGDAAGWRVQARVDLGQRCVPFDVAAAAAVAAAETQGVPLPEQQPGSLHGSQLFSWQPQQDGWAQQLQQTSWFEEGWEV